MGERASFVKEGGPEQAAAHSDRALMLMWPDYAGQGSYGTACLEQYTGGLLLLVGEWRDSTLGAYTAGVACGRPEHRNLARTSNARQHE